MCREGDHNTKHFSFTGQTAGGYEIPVVAIKKTRAGIVLASTLLARFGRVVFSMPGGGCVIGDRPINFFLELYARVGASVTCRDGNFICTMKGKTLSGFSYTFPKKSVTGTAAAVMLASVARGSTVLNNCAREPELVTVLNFLIESGVNIRGIGTDTIRITGRGALFGTAPLFENIPDRVQTDSFLVLSLLAGYAVTLKNCIPEHIGTETDILRSIGFNFEIGTDYIRIPPTNKHTDISTLAPFSIETREYPGFPTDAQTVFAVLATQLNGKSYIRETVFESRIEKQMEELKKMGASHTLRSETSVSVRGHTTLNGTTVQGLDLRSTCAFIIAGIIARGDTLVQNADMVHRGYEDIVTTINTLTEDGIITEKE